MVRLDVMAYGEGFVQGSTKYYKSRRYEGPNLNCNDGECEVLSAREGQEGLPRTRQLETYTPYNPHQELAHAIKAALTPSRKFGGPEVRIELPFDLLVFQGGLKVLGTYIKTFRGNDLYGINEYGDLVPLLGSRWHVRGINRHLDFCAVEKCSVVFHIFKKSSIEDYISEEKTELVPGGYTLVFKFVRFDGVRRQLHKFT